ncbi:MAG: hypothetical protein GX854_13995, partial [Clostridiales bacterium]|nr:hypothetical protein [Clostridiales bacterium]
MGNEHIESDNLLNVLKEREKELNCLYMVDEILENPQLSLPEIFNGIIRVLPSGWRFPELCRARILYKIQSYQSSGFISSPLSVTADIKTDGKIVGNLEVVYIKEVPATDEGYFLYKEKKLIKHVADRIGQVLVYRQMKAVMHGWEVSKSESTDSGNEAKEWEFLIDILKNTDHSTLLHICRKLTNCLLILGINEASELFYSSPVALLYDDGYANYPTAAAPIDDIECICEKAFSVAKKYIGADELKNHIKRWMYVENAYSLVKAIGSTCPILHNIIEALRKFKKSPKRDKLLFSPKG